MENNIGIFIEQVKNIVNSKGGKFFPIQYINGMNKIEFQCINGHEWWATPESVIQGKWCPICISQIKIYKKINKLNQMKTPKKFNQNKKWGLGY